MAVTLNASTTAGLVQTADTSGVLALQTAGTTAVTVDASQNVGVGVTPSAWDSTYKAIQVGARSMFFGIGSEANMANNAFYSAGYKYVATSAAGLYTIDANVHKWYNAASGTAGNPISFTQAMTLDASGRLGIGTTSPSEKLQVNGNIRVEGATSEIQMATGAERTISASGSSASTALTFKRWNGSSYVSDFTMDGSGNLLVGTTSGSYKLTVGAGGVIAAYRSDNTRAGLFFTDNNATILESDSTNSDPLHLRSNGSSGRVAFSTNSSERARIDSSGNLLVGTTTASAKLTVDSGSAGIYGYFNSTNANGGYLSIASSGTVQGDIGTAAQIVSGGANTDFGINARGSRNLILGTNNAERARIDTSGNLLVGKTAANLAAVGIEAKPNGYASFTMASSTNSLDTLNVYSSTAVNYRFYVGLAGTVFATNTAITAISDQRLKENIRDLDDGLNVVLALKPRKFDWKEGKGADIKNARGFIAQEFEQVLPDMIDIWKDPAPEGEEPYKAVNANLIPTLVKAIQEQQATITQLQADVAALKGASA